MANARSDGVGVLDRRSAASSSYDSDLYSWTVTQARAIRDKRWQDVDWENVAEEIESVGRSDRRAVTSHLEVLIAHLLKSIVQPERRTASWDQTIRNQRASIARLLDRNPSLRGFPAERFEETYGYAVSLARRDTGLDESRFPKQPPFSLEDVLSADFFPGQHVQGKLP
jgi:hypothetical protein